jgi:endothelin-converting enzyme/putative endopeptidase
MRFLGLRFSVILVLGLTLGFAVIAQSGGGSGRGFNLANLDTACKPCQDFINTLTAAGSPRIRFRPPFQAGARPALCVIRMSKCYTGFSKTLPKHPRSRRKQRTKIGAFYASCMNTAAIEAAGAKPLAPGFAAINKLDSTRELPALLAYLHTHGVGAFFGFSSTQDYKRARKLSRASGRAGLACRIEITI